MKKQARKSCDRAAIEKAIKTLNGILSNGPVPVIDIISVFEEEGIAPEAVIGAKQFLFVSSLMINGKRHWMLAP